MKRVGCLGGGQLALMLTQAAITLELDMVVWDEDRTTVSSLATQFIEAPFSDTDALSLFLSQVDVVTCEFENIPASLLEEISRSKPVYPQASFFSVTQDRVVEKTFLRDSGIPTVDFVSVEPETTFSALKDAIGMPFFLKSRSGGYDGKHQYRVKSESDWNDLPEGLFSETPFIAEAFAPFDFEISTIGVRSTTGECQVYPSSTNHHTEGILSLSQVEDLPETLQLQASDMVRSFMTQHAYVGVFVMEWFVVDGKLLANEYAPRVHNSGHWTIEGSVTSQFENHLRAITGMPLGDVNCVGFPSMVNLIGEIPALELSDGMTLHDYGKEPRKGRKVGHVTVVDKSNEGLCLKALQQQLV